MSISVPAVDAANRSREIQVWENTYIMDRKEEERFVPSKVEAVIKRCVDEQLNGKEFTTEEESKAWILDLCQIIKRAVRAECNVPRHKIIAQVAIGRNDGQGVRVASKSLWDTASDNWASYSLRTSSLFAVAMVFGLYYE